MVISKREIEHQIEEHSMNRKESENLFILDELSWGNLVVNSELLIFLFFIRAVFLLVYVL